MKVMSNIPYAATGTTGTPGTAEIPVNDNFEFQFNATKELLRECLGIAKGIEDILWGQVPGKDGDSNMKDALKSYWDLTTENKCGAENLTYLLSRIKEKL